ncbi:hypothetical protein OHO83_42590 [Streptomyces sp. NBC_00569]|uniref:hypothetical protein n=1 Tax=unclassified Streptomyces TaxID=2593676 RepID=UPI0022530717|nr:MULTISPECIES: hypothetical protein [unclassified Streptomyces]MCX5443041.1 hypothetical protein [Streptomyces sp. NBC_00063]WUB98466.1 hypothetical protein OHO83_42590 [Streptomyces sp. NBC_00569]
MATPTVPMFDASRRAEVVGAAQLPWQKQELIKFRDATVVTRSHDAMKPKPRRARLTISTP